MIKACKRLCPSRLDNQHGVTIVLVAILMVVFLGVAALAVDLSTLYVVRNELQNAADAGALAGARFLYNDSGTAVNPGANEIARQAARDNSALATGGAVAVEVNWTGGNAGDVQRGHWSFATRTFTANASLAPVDLANQSTESLDLNVNFINAIKVVARREAFPVASFFARIFGRADFSLSTDAVGYIGFAGSLRPQDVDQPIGICRQSIIDENGNYTCATGRMINSGPGATHNSAAWTNFSQPCQTAGPSSVRPLVCASGNPQMLDFGDGMGTIGGQGDNVYRRLRDCWLAAPDLNSDWRGYPRLRWGLTLPVIDCPDNNPGPCSELRGAVTLDVIWIKQSGNDPHWRDIPLEMEDWACSIWVAAGSPPDINALNDSQRQQCWQEFGDHFGLRTADGTSVGDLRSQELDKTVFFLPSCEPHEPRGNTGGENYGVLARIPVLVNIPGRDNT